MRLGGACNVVIMVCILACAGVFAQAAAPVYDFRRPTTLAREHARILELAFETFARQWGTQLTAKIRVMCQVGFVSVQMQAYDDAGGVGPLPALHIGQIFGAGYWVAVVLSPLVWIAGIVFSYLDWARLNAVGVERPFHWAWAFLTPLVYVIGRSVIVRRVAAPRGLVPIWVLLAVYAAGIVSSSIWSAIFSSDLMSQLNTIVSNT